MKSYDRHTKRQRKDWYGPKNPSTSDPAQRRVSPWSQPRPAGFHSFQSQDHHWSPFMIYHHAGCEATFMCKYTNTLPRQIGGSKKCLRCIVTFCRFTLDKPLHHLATATSHQICWKVSEHQTGKVQSFSALCLEKSGLQIWSTAGTWTWQSIWLSIPLRWMQKGRNIYCIIINII